MVLRIHIIKITFSRAYTKNVPANLLDIHPQSNCKRITSSKIFSNYSRNYGKCSRKGVSKWVIDKLNAFS